MVLRVFPVYDNVRFVNVAVADIVFEHERLARKAKVVFVKDLVETAFINNENTSTRQIPAWS